MTAQRPLGYSRAEGTDLVVAVVAGAASREVTHRCPPPDSGLTPCCSRPPFELPPGDRLTADADAVTCSGSHCDCCGHRYGGDHVPGACPCATRDAWDGRAG